MDLLKFPLSRLMDNWLPVPTPVTAFTRWKDLMSVLDELDWYLDFEKEGDDYQGVPYLTSCVRVSRNGALEI